MTVDRFYETYESWKAWDGVGFGSYDDVVARYYSDELRKAGIEIGGGISLLEIGFGYGAFAAWARSKGCQYLGTERDEKLVALARQNGFDALPAAAVLTGSIGRRKFSHAVAFDVLEHLSVDEMVNLIRAVFECLDDRGLFMVRVPSGDSPFARSIQHGDATHKTVIGSGMARQIAGAINLEVVQARAPVLPVFGVGIVKGVRRASVLAVRAIIAKIINVAFHDNCPRVISPNMIVVFRRRQDTR